MDEYNDGLQSLRNVIRQLSSIKFAYEAAMHYNPNYDVVIYVRPDLIFHDQFNYQSYLTIATTAPSRLISPAWQQWDGLNDRYAICGRRAASLYAQRIHDLSAYCALTNSQVRAEKALLFSAILNQLSYDIFAPERASRVRANGIIVDEPFITNQLDYKLAEHYAQIVSTAGKRRHWQQTSIRLGDFPHIMLGLNDATSDTSTH